MASRKPKKKSWLDALDDDFATSLENATDSSEEAPAQGWDKLPLRFAGEEDTQQQPEIALPQTNEQPAQPQEQSLLDRVTTNAGAVIDAMQSGAYRDLASVLNRARVSSNPIVAGAVTPITGLINALDTSVPASDPLSFVIGQNAPEQAKRATETLQARAKENADVASAVLDPIVKEGGLTGYLARTAQDAAQSGASSAASLFGGPLAGVVAGGITYANAYAEAKDAGASDADAEAYAISQGAVEGAFSSIQAGKWIPGSGVLKKKVADTVLERLGSPALRAGLNTLRTMAGEGVEEAATGAAQDLVGSWVAGQMTSADAKDKLQAQHSMEGFGERRIREFSAGALMGGLTAPVEVHNTRAEFNAEQQRRLRELPQGAVNRGLENLVTREPARPTNELNLPPVSEQQQQLATDMFPATDVGVDPAIAQREADLKAAEERVAWNQRNRERAAETDLENQRNGIVAQLDNATSRVENLRDRVENGDTSQATLNTLAAAQREQRTAQAELAKFDAQQPTAEVAPVAQEPQQLGLPLNEPKQPKRPAGGFVMSSETDRQNAELDKTAEATLKEQQKRDNKLIEDELKRQNADRDKRRKEALMAAADQSRNLTPDQRLKTIADAARTFDADNPAVARDQLDIEQLLAADRAKKKGGKKTKWTPTAATTAPTVPAPAGPEVTEASAPVPTATSEIGKRIEQLATKLPKAMAMEEGAATTAAPAFNRGKFVKDTGEIIRSLVKDNSQKAIDILNMEQQGKLAFVPNPESVGLDMSDNARAAYKVENGKMYIFTDRVNPKDAVGTIIRGYHEGTHAGQHSPREGRGAVMSTLLGDTKFGSAVDRVMAAANSGNAVAKSALRATEAQLGKDAVDTNPELFKKELMGHFVGEVVRARAKPLGSVAGVARDILAGARNAVRSVTGADLDVSFNDIYSAVNELGREIVATDVKGRDSNDVLAMIYNVREGKPSPGQKRAIEKGYVYDSVDGTKKYVLSDADATMSDYQYQQLIDTISGEPIPLGDVLEHEVLYRERPEADTEVSVKAVDTLGPGVFGQYDPESKTVLVANGAFKKGKDAVLGTIIHEIQHYVQDMDGRAQQFFEEDASGKLKAAEKKLASAARQNDLAANSMIDTAMRKYRGTDVGDSIQDVVNNINLKEPIKARLVGEILAKQPKLDGKLKEFYDDYIATRNKHNSELDKYHEVSAEEYAKYRRNITEKEAFFTQGQKKTTQAELDKMDIEDVMRNQERDAQGNDITEGQIDVPPTTGMRKAASAEQALAMEENTPIEITNRWLPAKIRGLFDATRGIGKIKNEIIEHAMDSPAGERMRAEASMGKYDRALIQQAAERGMTPTELNAEIEAAIQKLPQKLVGYDENIAAFNSVADKYGEAGEALKEMRDQIDALSLQMVEDRFASPIPLSAAEQKLYQTILNNLGKYNNRQYAAFAGAAGEKYSKAVWDDYLKRKKAGDVIDDVTEKNYQKVAKAVDKLVKDTLYIPDAEGLGNMKAERARRLYNTWIGNPENVELSDIKQALYDKREQINANKPILEQRAETIVKQLLGLTKLNEPIAQYYRGAKTDMGILKKRKEISPELRELLGEITDPSMAMLMTTAKLAEFTARTKMMLELSANVGGDLLPPQAIAPDNWQPLEGEGFGPLQGYKASPNLHAALSDVAQMHATFEQAVAMAANQPAELGRKLVLGASDAWGKAAKWQKTWQIVANPANFILNFGGGSMLMLQNGNVNPANMLRGLRDAADLVTYAMNPKVAKPSSIRLVENGVVDSAFIGEIKAEQFRELNTLIKQMSGRSDSEAMALVKKYFTKALAGGKEAYAMADVLYKIANFHHQVDHLTKFYEAEGKDVTPEQIDREAATDVKRTNFTYRRAAPLIKALEQRGFTMFGPYMSEVFRTQVTNILQGIGEIQRGNAANTPEGKRIMTMRGASRIAGQLVSYGLIYGAGKLLASATFGDDEEKESALRSLLPEYLRDQDFGLMGKDENGYPVLYQMSRLDPVGPATDLLRAAYNGDDVTVKDILAKVADTYVTPRLAGRTYELGKAIMTDKAPSREPLAKQVAPEFYSDMVDISKKFGLDRATVLALTNIGESFMPGFMNSWRDSNGRVVGDTPQDAVFRIASYSGFTFNSLDPSKPLTFAARDYSSATKDARTRLAEFFRDNPDRTDLEIQNELLRLQKDEYDAFTQLVKVRKGAGVLEYPTAEAAAIMKKARLNTTQMRAIANGDFKSSVVSRASIQRYRDQDLADAKPSERTEIRKRWKEIENRLMAANKNLKRGDE